MLYFRYKRRNDDSRGSAARTSIRHSEKVEGSVITFPEPRNLFSVDSHVVKRVTFSFVTVQFSF